MKNLLFFIALFCFLACEPKVDSNNTSDNSISIKHKDLLDPAVNDFVQEFPEISLPFEITEETFLIGDYGNDTPDFKSIPRDLAEKMLGVEFDEEAELPSQLTWFVGRFYRADGLPCVIYKSRQVPVGSGNSDNYPCICYNEKGEENFKDGLAHSYGWDGGYEGKTCKINKDYSVAATMVSERTSYGIIEKEVTEEISYRLDEDGVPADAKNLSWEMKTNNTKDDNKLITKTVNKETIREKLGIKEAFESAYSWEDKNGTNFLVFTEEEDAENSGNLKVENIEVSKIITAKHFWRKDDKIHELWDIRDFVKLCDFDLYMDIIDNSFSITDIDGDGIAEVTFMYYLGCISDVSPVDVKLMMHENGTKYALRGSSRVSHYLDIDEGSGLGEDPQYTIDPNFKKTPKKFLDFAKEVWEENDIVY